MNATAAPTKAALRQHFRHRRQELLPAAQAPIQALAQLRLPGHLGSGSGGGDAREGGRIGIYWPLTGEVDLRPLVAWLPQRLALPAALPEPSEAGQAGTCRLAYRAWHPNQPLQPDACGIPAPTGADLAPGELALLLVPALAYDRRGYRLGAGGGWYDRLRAASAWRAVPALIAAPAGCQLAELPADPWDIPFDGWLNERELHWLAPPGRASGAGPAEGGPTVAT